jgi:phosphate-selective porin OprO/OprP
LTFLERDVLSEGIWASLFSPGIQWSDTYFNNNVTMQTMVHKVQPVNQIFTNVFGDGNYASTSRLTWTPLYENDGSHIVHLGGSYQWRTGNLGREIQPGGTGNTFADTQDVVRFRARPELRDAVGVGTGGNLGGDTGRFVDTGYLLTSHVQTFSPEFLAIMGPFAMQAEAAWSQLSDTRSIYPTTGGAAARPNLIPRGTPTFWGGYVEASYFLTGEHRGYNRQFGYPDRPTVREPFFLVRGEDGNMHCGLGAWQLGYRYSYLDLNDNGINGGQLSQHTVALNWYWNDNAKIQFQYSNIQRNVIAPAISGTVHGFGTLVQFYF